MERILILGGGVGGTLTANLLVKKLRRQVKAGEVTITRRRPDRPAHYQPGFMYIAMGGERAERLQRPERGAARCARRPRHRRDRAGRRADPDRPSHRRRAARLRLPRAGDRFADRARGDRALRHRGPALLHGRGGPRAPPGAGRVHGGRIVIGIAGMPYKCPPAPLEVAFLIESRAARARPPRAERGRTTARRSGGHSRSRASPRWRRPSSRRRASSCTRSSTSRRSIPAKGRRRASRARSSVRPAHPRAAAQGPAVPHRLGLAPAPGGWLPTDRATLQVGGRPNVFALGEPPTCRSRRQARPPTSRRRS